MAKNQNNNIAPATQKTDPGAKKDALATALAQIEKQFGKGAVMKLGDNAAMQVDAISTGSIGLDLALGVGGVPRGRIIEVYGPESSGKTTLALHVLAEAQKKGGDVAFIDVEHALDPVYAEALGVDINNLLVSQPDTGEQAMEICEALVRSGAIDVIVVDSVAALVPRAEIEAEISSLESRPTAELTPADVKRLGMLQDARMFQGEYFTHVSNGKGGRERLSPIIGPNAAQIVQRIQETPGEEKVWQHVHQSADIHGYRAEYATAIYKAHARAIQDIPYDRINRGTGRRYQSQVYTCRKDEAGRKLDKAAMLVCSKALGHNRISVVADNYIRGL